MQVVQFPPQNPSEAIPGNPMPPAPAAPATHFPPTSAMPPFPAFPGQNIQTNQYITGQRTQWTWQPIPVGNQIQQGPPPFQPGQIVPPLCPQSFNNSSQSSYPPNIFPAETFMIQVPPTAVQSPWTTGLFDCLDDPLSAAVACLFPCVTFGQVAEIVDSGSTSCATGAILYGGIQFLIGCPCLISCGYRTRLRAKFNLMESPASDWITHFFCECCALAQEYRELNNRGYDPAIGWQGNVAKIRSVQQQQQLAMAPPMDQTMRVIKRPSCLTSPACKATAVTIRCEQNTQEGISADVWLGRFAMVGFAAAISVEIATGKGLLENFGLTNLLPTVALAVTGLVGVLVAVFIFQSASKK